MMVTPCIYYAVLDKWSGRQYVKWTLVAGLGSGVAIFFSLVILCFQIGAAKGGFMDGVAHVIWSFGKRTYGETQDYPAVYAASLEAGTSRGGHYLRERYFLRSQQLSIQREHFRL